MAVQPEGAVLPERTEPKLGAGQQMVADGKNPFQRVCSQCSNGPENEKRFTAKDPFCGRRRRQMVGGMEGAEKRFQHVHSLRGERRRAREGC